MLQRCLPAAFHKRAAFARGNFVWQHFGRCATLAGGSQGRGGSPGADGQSGCGRSVRLRTVSPGACVDDNKYPLSARGAISHLSRAHEIKTICKMFNFNFYLLL